jgi:hypothetical protein
MKLELMVLRVSPLLAMEISLTRAVLMWLLSVLLGPASDNYSVDRGARLV